MPKKRRGRSRPPEAETGSPPENESSPVTRSPRDWGEIGRSYAMLLLSAILAFLGFAGFDLWPLAFVAMVPALFVMDGRTGPGGPPTRPEGWAFYRRALFFGYVSYYGGFYWVVNTIVDFGGFPYPLALAFASIFFLYQAHQFVLVLWLWRRARERGWNPTLALVSAYLAAELVYPTLFDHFYGNSFHMLPRLIQVADLGGPMLLTALAMAGSGALFELIDARVFRAQWSWRSPAAFAVSLLFCLSYGAYRFSDVEQQVSSAETLTVGVVQTNMGILAKRDEPGEGLRRHLEQSRLLEAAGDVDLLVWPESAATFILPRRLGYEVRPYFRNALRMYGLEASDFPQAPVIFGGLSADRSGERPTLYNTAFITDAEGVVRAHYDKTYLLGFGEYLPFGDVFPILYEWSPNTGRFTPGNHVRPLPLRAPNGAEYRISALVCYEDILPGFVRRVVAEANPHLLVNATNDAWFGDTNEPAVHLALAKMRAVEHHRYLVRATNTGISAIVDPLGRTVAEGPLFDRWQGAAEVALLEGTTVYGIAGDWPGWIALAGILLMAFRRRRSVRT